MSELVIASTEADSRAAEAVRQHHAELAGALKLRVEELFTASMSDDGPAADAARDDLVGWCRRELVPHALAEEHAMYPAARATDEGRLLVEGMLGEHQVILGLIDDVAELVDVPRAAAAAVALATVFDSHLAKENDLVIPLLAVTPGVSLAELLDGMHDLLGGHAHEQSGGCGGHTCSCGEVDGPGYPVLDARTIPHAIRHATIFGALDSVRPGAGLELVAPHDPLPLLDQINHRWPGVFAVDYRERGPEAWRLTLVRAG
jgi:uncharacterized protein (DUF2249 family)